MLRRGKETRLVYRVGSNHSVRRTRKSSAAPPERLARLHDAGAAAAVSELANGGMLSVAARRRRALGLGTAVAVGTAVPVLTMAVGVGVGGAGGCARCGGLPEHRIARRPLCGGQGGGAGGGGDHHGFGAD